MPIQKKKLKPKFKGLRKGYVALFLGESTEAAYDCRVRAVDDTGRWKWGWADFDKFDNDRPCWHPSTKIKATEAVTRMKQYDKSSKRKTIFLGYVKK